MLLIVAVIAFAAGLLLLEHEQTRRGPNWIDCRNHLRQVGLAFATWARDHNDRLPMNVPASEGGSLDYVATGEVFRHFQVMSNYLSTPKLLACPLDNRTAATNWGAGFSSSNICYFVGLDATASPSLTFLAGDRNLTNGTTLPPNRILELTTNRPVGWASGIHTREARGPAGNIVLSDGSARPLTNVKLREALAASGGTNRLAVP